MAIPGFRFGDRDSRHPLATWRDRLRDAWRLRRYRRIMARPIPPEALLGEREPYPDEPILQPRPEVEWPYTEDTLRLSWARTDARAWLDRRERNRALRKLRVIK